MGNETSNMTASPVLLCRLARQGDAVALSTALARLTPAAKRAYLETHDDESTPLEIATTRGHVECVRELVHAGADVNRRYRHSQTVLHLAVHTGNRAIVWLLVHTVGVERNAVDANGDTPLLLAAHDGQPEAMEALLTSTGVDIFARNTQTDKDVFTATRTACATAPTAEKPRFKKCIATMEKMLGIRHGWLFEYTEGVAPGSGLWLWRKRYYMIYRDPDPEKVVISLFPPLRDDPASPTAELIYHGAHADLATAVPTSLGMAAIPQSFYERPHRFALRCSEKNDPLTLKVLEFAATNQDELDLWWRLPVRLTSASTPIHSTAIAARPAAAAAMTDEPNDLNRVIQASLEESQRSASNPELRVGRLDTSAGFETDQSAASISPFGLSCRLAQLPRPASASATEPLSSQQQELSSVTASSGPDEPSPSAAAIVDPASTESSQLPSLDSAIGASTCQAQLLSSVNPVAATVGDCIVCYDAIQSVACVPCGHVAMCVKCAQHVMLASRSCPVCRAHVSSTLKIFHV